MTRDRWDPEGVKARMGQEETESLRIHLSQVTKEAWCARLEGSFEAADIEGLDAVLQGVPWKVGIKLIVNLEGMRYVSPDELVWFLRTHIAGLRTGVRIVFVACPLPLKDALSEVGLSKVLRFANDEASALEQA